MIFEDAVGFLIGEENNGLACMFTMMNNARLSVGVQGVALAERATQAALAYARERRQGRAPGASDTSAIVEHPGRRAHAADHGEPHRRGARDLFRDRRRRSTARIATPIPRGRRKPTSAPAC